MTYSAPLVTAEFAPTGACPIWMTTPKTKRLFREFIRAQKRAQFFAQRFTFVPVEPGSPLFNRCSREAKASKTERELYAQLRNREIQAWNVLAKHCGLPKLPNLTLGRGRRLLLVDRGQQLQVVPILPVVRVGNISRREWFDSRGGVHDESSCYDTEVFVGPTGRRSGGKEALYDHEGSPPPTSRYIPPPFMTPPPP